MSASERSAITRTRRVIVAEDDPDMGHVLEFLLVREGFLVERFQDGRAALRRVREGDPVDAVVLDVMMPFVGGREVVRRMRVIPGWERVPVVMVSGMSAETDVVAALEAGANDYLTKPFRPREFVARVHGLIDRQRAAERVA